MLLEINNLNFSYSVEKPLFEDFSLNFENGKIYALAGESGCGKSTLLNLIYGLLQWSSGEIIFDGRKLLGPNGNIVPGEAEMKFVAQNYDLMPYSTVYDNVGKFISNINLASKRAKVMELLEVVGMEGYIDAYPKNLSGGQQQRVAIARALSVKPKLLLLDEPFSNLDFSRKIKLRERLFSYVKKEDISLIVSTHDVPEIMPWLDEIVVLKDGKVEQKSNPKEMFENPKNSYVAHLFGEVNEFSDDERIDFGVLRKFYYPHQIKINIFGKDAEVLESLYSGGFYWNKLLLKGKTIIMHSSEPLLQNVKIEFQ